ncbi:MAG: DUF1036 domain-containing protein [Parasphingorhabdus sp.]|uniref:DUF1036 domain-containing protein n=1 Tax=Parasphingorhabdus sp. TaxID=2709688 RepID=UPI0032662057
MIALSLHRTAIGTLMFSVCLAMSGIWLPEPARAGGSKIDLSKFCDGRYRTGLLRGLQGKIGAKWNPKRNKWGCYIPSKYGYGTVTPATFKPLGYAEACRKLRGTSLYHLHGRTLHCGRDNARHAQPSRQPPPGPPSTGNGRGEAQYTALSMCNRSRTDTIYAAWVWHDWGERKRPKNWRAQGWISLPRGSCERIEFPHYRNGGPYDGTVFLHATSDGVNWGKGDYAFCMHPSDFDYLSADRMACTAPDQWLAETFEFRLNPGAENRFNFN